VGTGGKRIEDKFFGKDPKRSLADLEANAKGLSADFSLGHDVLDEDLIGAERGNFFVIAGTPAAGKTWFMLKTMYELWKMGLNILFVSLELSEKLLRRRLDSLVAGIKYSKFRRGLLTPEERKSFMFKLYKNKRRENFFEIVTSENSDPTSGNTVGKLDFIYSKVRQHKPDIVAVDGFYLMAGKGDSDWERMASLTRGFHHLTQATGVCGWATTQLTKTSDEKNPKLRDLSYSWTFAQDSDGVFLLSRPEDMRLAGEVAVTVGKFREAEDNMRYILEFDPGATVDLQRLEIPSDNPLMD